MSSHRTLQEGNKFSVLEMDMILCEICVMNRRKTKALMNMLLEACDRVLLSTGKRVLYHLAI